MGSPARAPRLFDLNIQKILEGWELCHATREVIANALDEQALTDTRDITIDRVRKGTWRIRDYGRGVRYEHLAQNENAEKLKNHAKVIGRFGVGLKDALATFSRRGVTVTIQSRFNDISFTQRPKHDFDDVVTLQAEVCDASDPQFAGTEVTLTGIEDEDIEQAKKFFLKYTGDQPLETTRYGQILSRVAEKSGRIYVNGLVVAEEENFAFSYNITALTAAMRRALNRERTNVGRTAYVDRVQDMLVAASSASVANTLAAEMAKVERGTNADEVGWIDIAVHACKILNAAEKVVFVTAFEATMYRDAVDRAQREGCRIVTVPDNVRQALETKRDLSGNEIRTLKVFDEEWQESFKFEFVPITKLTAEERRVFGRHTAIAALVGGLPKCVKRVLVSETMRPDMLGSGDATGVWEEAEGRIIIKRSELTTVPRFAGTFLHEVAHAKSKCPDVDREFEQVLTSFLGRVAGRALASGA